MKQITSGLSLFLSLIFLALNLQASDRAHDEQVWRSIGLDVGFMTTEVLNPHVCESTDVLLFGCVRAIDSLLAEYDAKDVTFFTTSTWLETLKKFAVEDNLGTTYSVVKDFGFYKIVKSTQPLQSQESDQDVIAELIKGKDREKQEQAHWKQVFAGIKNNPISYGDLIAWITANRITKDDESLVVGTAFNEFLMTAIDAHSYIMPKAMYDELSNGTNDDFTGIGVQIKSMNGKTIVTQPIEGGPGFKGGIRSNDVIVKVGDKDITGLTSEQVADLIQGPEGTPVTIVVQRKTQFIPLNLVRAKIHQENVTGNLVSTVDALTSVPHNVGYIKLRSFMVEGMCATVRDTINKLVAQKAEALILDLRDNGGGSLNEAACIAGLFVGKGKLVVEQRTLNPRIAPSQNIMSTADKIVNVPVVTLVNSNSASASEVLSGDLQDYRSGPIVGVQTWGKASVQSVGPWNVVPNTMFAMTIARFYLPGNASRPEHTNQIVGIIPDVEAYAVPNPTEVDKFAYREVDLSPIVLSQQDTDANPPYPQMTAFYQQCLQQHGVAKKVFASQQDQQVAPDYQRLVGLDAAVCSLMKQPATQVNTSLAAH